MNSTKILLLVALILFVLAAFGVLWPHVSLIPLGLACWAATSLIQGWPASGTPAPGKERVSTSKILVLIAMVLFLLAAFGVQFGPASFIPLGLAVWVGALFV